MGKWGCWLAVAVHVVVRGKEVMLEINVAHAGKWLHYINNLLQKR